MGTGFKTLLTDIRACEVCAAYLQHGPRPVLQAHPDAKLLIVSQAPGRRVHASGIPFDDKSGEKLRMWLGIDEPTFHDERKVAIVPMAFCYPGKGASGDLPPRRECAPRWHPLLLPRLRNIELTLAIGGYAIDALLGKSKRATLTDTVRAWREYIDEVGHGCPNFDSRDQGRSQRPANIMPLPHPSPRNTAWFIHNPWFEREAIPTLRERVRKILS
ncbi:MAG TPA: uracil-DNA glycosylase family protein [Rhodanobacteraceae bacterium]|nr:uracil-DNA glycosylase family protein [Rhodanobacteraceae bacterium]